ncbi:Ionotropic receptor 10a [Carabus blaptoides fortunei]
MFVRRPSAVLVLPKAIKESSIYKILSRSGGYGGVDGMVLAMIADYLNFTVTIVTPPADREYGFVARNGTIVGSLGDVGSLYNSYSKTLYFRDINTLEELDKSGIQIVTSSTSMIEVFGNDTNPIMQRLKNKILLYNTSSLDMAANSRNLAAFERKNDASIKVKTEYTRVSDGMEMLHVMNECPWSYYVTYIVPRGSPYLPVFDMLITTFREAGLISKWSRDTTDAFILEKRVPPTMASDILKPFTLSDMQTAFFLLSFGLIIAMLSSLNDNDLWYNLRNKYEYQAVATRCRISFCINTKSPCEMSTMTRLQDSDGAPRYLNGWVTDRLRLEDYQRW